MLRGRSVVDVRSVLTLLLLVALVGVAAVQASAAPIGHACALGGVHGCFRPRIHHRSTLVVARGRSRDATSACASLHLPFGPRGGSQALRRAADPPLNSDETGA